MPRFVDPIQMKSSPVQEGVTQTVIGVNGDFYQPIAAVDGGTTTPAEIPNYGVTLVSASGGTRNYALSAPVAGIHKTIFCTAGSTTNTVKVDAGTGVTFDGSKRYAIFNGVGDCLDLVGMSTTRWLIKSKMGSVALSSA